MQGTNWVKVSEKYPERVKLILFYAGGETHAGWRIDEGCGFYSIKISQWFDYSDVIYWGDLPLPPKPEGE
ncbi:hypothetical protein [Proteus mirabilis]|uniref:hypothetical protein n=1 Tax=Proteus mirabilis TaxID=584 RepID=UPI002024BC10|nr:hypothetical protein [Proteus mirabilis]EMD5788157.1 hypothetical protein [Proteus mirabilis]MCL8621717.1 hypothetical protein [Proteus mirabilis]MCL8632539.1 hypothetical protein [Proteus mirabilis]MCU9582554.1 hypothetical protein [Proteus mirabilis]MCU9603068.1 hypothetical protein [Proteus mirabilis]